MREGDVVVGGCNEEGLRRASVDVGLAVVVCFGLRGCNSGGDMSPTKGL